MSFATVFTTIGKSLRASFGPDAAEKERREQRVNELRTLTLRAHKLKGLKEYEGWSIYQSEVMDRLGALSQQLKTVSADKLPILQAQIAEIEGTLKIIPKCLEEAREASEELDSLQGDE